MRKNAKIIDTHCHYDDAAFDEDRDEILKSLSDSGIEKVIDGCSTIESLDLVKTLMEKHPFVYGAVGVHPDYANEMTEDVFEKVRLLCRHKKTVAVGEIGLDYYWHNDNKEKQIYWFERFLDLAKEERLPVVIHSRDAAEDTLTVIKRHFPCEKGGVMHCYSYSKELAKDYIELGLHFGIGGVVTFKNARKLKEVVEYLPIDRILLETDCPYLSPEPYRGKRNSSLNLIYVAEMIANIKGMSVDEVANATFENAMRVFGD